VGNNLVLKTVWETVSAPFCFKTAILAKARLIRFGGTDIALLFVVYVKKRIKRRHDE